AVSPTISIFFFKHLAGGDFQTLTIKRFRHLFLHVVGKCVSNRTQAAPQIV
ncbi:hypothetical protein SPAR38_1093, partial [Streptococcus pneumoniae GA16121]